MQTLIIHYPNGRDDNIPLSKPQMLVGSSGDCDIVIAAEGVSPLQMTIFVSNDIVEVVNLQHPESVLLNDVPCHSRSRMMLGDVLRIVDVTLSLRVPTAAPVNGTKSPEDSRLVWDSVRRLGVAVAAFGCFAAGWLFAVSLGKAPATHWRGWQQVPAASLNFYPTAIPLLAPEKNGQLNLAHLKGLFNHENKLPALLPTL